MTRDNVKKLLPVLTAYAEGKKIQWFYKEKWNDLENHVGFDSDPQFYRVKSEPITLYLSYAEDRPPYCFKDEESAKEFITRHGGELKKFVEVPLCIGE